jgi:hypothetical protein
MPPVCVMCLAHTLFPQRSCDIEFRCGLGPHVQSTELSLQQRFHSPRWCMGLSASIAISRRCICRLETPGNVSLWDYYDTPTLSKRSSGPNPESFGAALHSGQYHCHNSAVAEASVHHEGHFQGQCCHRPSIQEAHQNLQTLRLCPPNKHRMLAYLKHRSALCQPNRLLSLCRGQTFPPHSIFLVGYCTCSVDRVHLKHRSALC